jgi:hypothetical protein
VHLPLPRRLHPRRARRPARRLGTPDRPVGAAEPAGPTWARRPLARPRDPSRITRPLQRASIRSNPARTTALHPARAGDRLAGSATGPSLTPCGRACYLSAIDAWQLRSRGSGLNTYETILARRLDWPAAGFVCRAGAITLQSETRQRPCKRYYCAPTAIRLA